MVQRYRKKPTATIEAVQLNWRNWGELCDFVDFINEDNPGREVYTWNDTCGEPGPTYIELTVPTMEGPVTAKHGDWIARGVEGEYWPIKASIFEKTYDAVEMPLNDAKGDLEVVS